MRVQPISPGRWLALLVVVMLLATPALGQEPLPTMAELKKMFDDGQHKPLLAKIARVSQLRGDAAAPYDKVELETLRADTHIQLKQQPQAMTAIAEAVKSITSQTNPTVAAQARATQILLKNATSLAYAPKVKTAGGPMGPISLLDMKQRPAAYTALLADMQIDVDKSAKAARTSKSLPPIITAIRGIGDMAAVELVATGKPSAPGGPSQKAGDDLAVQAHKLMNDEVAVLAKRVRAIDDAANTLIEDTRNLRGRGGYGNKAGPAPVEKIYRKTGLNSTQRRELNEIVDTCDQIAAAAVDFETVSATNAPSFKSLGVAVTDVSRDARTTLTADYHSVQEVRTAKDSRDTKGK